MSDKTKTFKMDEDTERALIALADEDQRSQAGEVRFLILTEYDRRQIARSAQALREGKPAWHPGAEPGILVE